jgi:hypothetical protein
VAETVNYRAASGGGRTCRTAVIRSQGLKNGNGSAALGDEWQLPES